MATKSSQIQIRLSPEEKSMLEDLDDVRFLLRYLDLSTVDEALAVVARYFDEDRLPPKSRLALGELLGDRSGPG